MTAVQSRHGSEASEEPSEEESEEKKRWRPKAKTNKPLCGRITCMNGLFMSVQVSSVYVCTPRDDRGPHSTVEVGCPSETEPMILPYSDGTSVIYGRVSTMYVNVPAEVIRDVVCKHYGLRSDSNARIPELVETEAAAAASATTTVTEVKEERDERGSLWLATCVSPSSTEESNVMSDESHSPYSMTHMGESPPPPPPITPIPGEITPPQQVREGEISPIERKKED